MRLGGGSAAGRVFRVTAKQMLLPVALLVFELRAMRPFSPPFSHLPLHASAASLHHPPQCRFTPHQHPDLRISGPPRYIGFTMGRQSADSCGRAGHVLRLAGQRGFWLPPLHAPLHGVPFHGCTRLVQDQGSIVPCRQVCRLMSTVRTPMVECRQRQPSPSSSLLPLPLSYPLPPAPPPLPPVGLPPAVPVVWPPQLLPVGAMLLGASTRSYLWETSGGGQRGGD